MKPLPELCWLPIGELQRLHEPAKLAVIPKGTVPVHSIGGLMNLDQFADQTSNGDHRAVVGDPLPQAIEPLSSNDEVPAEPYAEANRAVRTLNELPPHLLGDGQISPVTQPGCVIPDLIESGQPLHDAQHPIAALDPLPSPEANLTTRSSISLPQAAAAEEVCAEIRRLHRRATFCTAQRVCLGNRLAAFVRTEFLGFTTTQDETSREKAVKASQKMIAAARKGQPIDLPDDQVLALKALIAGTDAAIAPFETIEENCLKAMERLVRKLPAHGFMLATRGFGARSFARIIGEAGALHLYAGPAKLWKRLGVAVIGGERQRKYADKDLAVIHGYNPRRRSVSWVAFDSLLKAQGTGEDAGRYRAYYDRKKAEYLERGWTKIHAHRAAARYSEKKLLRNLWKAWRAELRGHLGADNQHFSAPHPIGDQESPDALVSGVADPLSGQPCADAQRPSAAQPLAA